MTRWNGNRTHVVIVGAGFGGLSAARALGSANVDVTVIDKRNHHLFQPLLYQVATAGLSPADIAAPIRHILRKQANTRVILDIVTGIDPVAKTVTLGNNDPVGYDILVLATGARHSYFGRDEWAEHAPGIKTIDDATAVRRKVLIALEHAETEIDLEKRKSWLTFVVIGGGPTGVEMAGAIAELSRRSVSKDFRSITPHCSRVILIDGGQRLLASFPESLSRKAQRAIEQLGVEVMLGERVNKVGSDGVLVGDEFVPAHTAIWAAGVAASPAATWLTIQGDAAGRLPVESDLKVRGFGDIYAIGDTVSCTGHKGRQLPGVAPVAKQQGKYVARSIRSTLSGRKILPFRYRDFGNLATIGRHRAIIALGRFQMSGPIAWFLWCIAHIWFLAGYRNRLIVGANWLWSYISFGRSARLITGDVAPEIPQSERLHIAA